MMFYVDKKYGFYRVNHNQQIVETFSKIEALELAQRYKGSPSYHFHDEIFSSYDWKKEIKVDINNLYRKRAEQLRAQYKHLVLLYSGGFDSNNILKTFVNNNIYLDAVVCFYYSVDHDNKESDINQEWQLQTWPRLQRLLPLVPQTELIRLDLTDLSLNIIEQLYDEYLYYIPGYIAPNSLSRSFIKSKLPKKYRESDVGIMYGHEKPRLRFKDDKFIFNFSDIGNTNRPIIQDSGVEWFYWSPSCPELVIKQAQLLKNFWSSNKGLINSHFKNRKNLDLGTVLDHDYVPAQRIVYPQCEENLYYTWRPQSNVFGSRDQWLYDSNTDSRHKIMKIYQSLCELPKNWFNDGVHEKGLIGSLSKDYIL